MKLNKTLNRMGKKMVKIYNNWSHPFKGLLVTVPSGSYNVVIRSVEHSESGFLVFAWLICEIEDRCIYTGAIVKLPFAVYPAVPYEVTTTETQEFKERLYRDISMLNQIARQNKIRELKDTQQLIGRRAKLKLLSPDSRGGEPNINFLVAVCDIDD
jgi:hypothetical protein